MVACEKQFSYKYLIPPFLSWVPWLRSSTWTRDTGFPLRVSSGPPGPSLLSSPPQAVQLPPSNLLGPEMKWAQKPGKNRKGREKSIATKYLSQFFSDRTFQSLARKRRL